MQPGFPELPAQAWPELARHARVAAPDLRGDAFGNVLALHTTTLNALLRGAAGQDAKVAVVRPGPGRRAGGEPP